MSEESMLDVLANAATPPVALEEPLTATEDGSTPEPVIEVAAEQPLDVEQSPAEDPLFNLLNWRVGGLVIDDEMAKAGPCFDIDLGDGRHVAAHDGIMGLLDESQQALYCMTREEASVDPVRREQIKFYVDVAEACRGETTPDGLIRCMERELAARAVPQG